jgi:hypothetical protein
MWYPPNQPYRRRMRRGIGFPFIFPFLMLFVFHSGSIFFATLVLAIMIALILKAFDASNPNRAGQSQQTPYYQPPAQSYQPPYYQPSVPVYQPSPQAYQPPYPQEEYKPYEQGYQAAATPYLDDQQTVSATSSYDDYEQPIAQYPEQMPPMEQEQS